MYREVQLDFTPEIKVFSKDYRVFSMLFILFDRAFSIFTVTSKEYTEYFNFLCKIQLDHPVV